MKCFYHAERDAVGVCKSCHRGVCPDCAADVPPGIACRGKCETEVSALNLVLERGKSAYQKAGVAYRRNAVALLVAGLFFLGFGLLLLLTSPESGGVVFFLPMGGLFLLWSFFSYRSGKQIVEVSTGKPPATSAPGGGA